MANNVPISNIEATGSTIEPNDLFLMSKHNPESNTYTSVKVFGSTLQKSFGNYFLDVANIVESPVIHPGDDEFWGTATSDNGDKWVETVTRETGLKSYTGHIVITTPFDCVLNIVRSVVIQPINTDVREFYHLNNYVNGRVYGSLMYINRSPLRYTVYTQEGEISRFFDSVINSLLLKANQKLLLTIYWGFTATNALRDGYYGKQPTTQNDNYWIDESNHTDVLLKHGSEIIRHYGNYNVMNEPRYNWLQYQVIPII